MTPDEIVRRLDRIRRRDLPALEGLAGEIADEARRPLLCLSQVVGAIEGPDLAKARLVLDRLGELAVLPWLAASRTLPLTRKIAAITFAYRAYAGLLQPIVAELERMLGRKTLLRPPDLYGPVEEPPPVLRECDEGYMLLRRVLRPEEPWREYVLARAEFSRASEMERDAAIAAYLTGKGDA